MKNYETPDPLAVRVRTHELYSEPKLDFAPWVLDRIEWSGDERVLDVGCGNGGYRASVLERARSYVGGDMSRGMRPDVQLVAAGLPFPDDAFDVVLANHMLYHVPDIDAAVAELARVGRTLIASTNSVDTMKELTDAQERALGQPPRLTDFSSTKFSLENGSAYLERHFANVRVHKLEAALVFPDAEPVLAYIESGRDFLEDELPSGSDWDAFMEALRAEIGDGEFRVNKTTGAFVCR
ncbi:MAG: class I SAM-dependent methyltransferase [Planctomycetota bacterium]